LLLAGLAFGFVRQEWSTEDLIGSSTLVGSDWQLVRRSPGPSDRSLLYPDLPRHIITSAVGIAERPVRKPVPLGAVTGLRISISFTVSMSGHEMNPADRDPDLIRAGGHP
jgi:hypothetical protein